MRNIKLNNPSPDKYLSNKHTVAEVKLDGVRGIMHITESGEIALLSRKERQNGELTDFSNKLPQLTLDPEIVGIGSKGYTVLDGELTLPQDNVSEVMKVLGSSDEEGRTKQREVGYITFNCFDIIWYQGQSLTNLLWFERRKILESLPFTSYFKIVPYTLISPDEQESIYLQHTQNNKEGVVYKDPNSRYLEKNSWIKRKVQVSLDLLITGYVLGKGKYEGTIGALKLSAWVGDRLIEVCKASPGTDEDRYDMFMCLSNLSEEEIIAEKAIVEVIGQGITSKHRLRHPRVVRYRWDKSVPDVLVSDKE